MTDARSCLVADWERTLRSRDASCALERALAYLEERYGITIGDYPVASSHVAFARDRDGEELVYGLGKGVHARLGAFGECIEHLHLNLAARGVVRISRVLPVDSLYREDTLIRFGLSLGQSEQIEAIPFKPWPHGNEENIPLCLANHDFYSFKQEPLTSEELFFSNYATSSGTAFGFTREDAVLHGILEVLERDITSNYFLALLNKDSRDDFSSVSPGSVPTSCQQMLEELRSRNRVMDINIIYGENPFGVHWFLTKCKLAGSETLLPVWGAGCSLWGELALYRSVAECLQMIDATSSEEMTGRIQKFLTLYPGLSPVFHLCDSPLHLPQIGFEHISDNAPARSDVCTSLQIDTLAKNLGRTGRKVFYTDLAETTVFHVTTTFITNVDRFFNITHCTPVLPLSELANAVTGEALRK